ncbi:ROK family protein [Compostimonas suwonensis]|uniref:Glucokinase n=1 Tax=Compostimonas suwonensis TaxID=1048394 RepID=A0A2M9BU67_9MICO|nr:ROK family protein [Compostimonas suwonensis]PJJ61489.1 glucokinase [Compostimonas suwonensis]
MPEKLAVAVDFGGTKVEAALVSANGTVVEGSRHRAPTGRAADSSQLEQSVTGVVASAIAARPQGDTIVGVGIGSAGPVLVSEGLVSPLNVPAWRDYPMRELIRSSVAGELGDVPVELQMDGVAITLAEHWVGAGQGVDNLMGMVVSTGIGGGLILGGRVVAGPTGNAGHIGHVDVAGIVGEDTFGNRGSLEAIASGPHTVAWANSQGWVGGTGEELAASYAAGDELARQAIVRTGTALGQAIASATALLDLELVAIGGGFSQSTPDLLTVIRETIARHHFGFVRKVRVAPSGLSGTGPLVGAGAIIHRAEMLRRP